MSDEEKGVYQLKIEYDGRTDMDVIMEVEDHEISEGFLHIEKNGRKELKDIDCIHRILITKD